MEYRFLTGGYAGPEDAGVCRFSFDPEKGFALKNAWTDFINPSYILKHPALPVLYTVEEVTPNGAVRAWKMGGDTLRELCAFPSGGSDPCHLSLSADAQSLYAANYTSGSLAVFSLDDNGKILEMSDFRQHRGSGPNRERQESAHVHCSLEMDGILYVCDLGMDQIAAYRNENGKLTQVGGINMKSGSGPRHLASSKRLPGHLYCVGELDSHVYHLAEKNGKYEMIQAVSALPPDFAGENTGAAIHFTEDGKCLLVSNRGHDSIAVFPVGETGRLGQPVITQCVAQPRDFAVYDDWVIAGSQRDSVIRAYHLDREALTLADTGYSAEVKSPTCFVRVE